MPVLASARSGSSGVNVAIDGNAVSAKGPKGELARTRTTRCRW